MTKSYIYECKTYAVNQAKAAQEYCADRRIEFKIITERTPNQMNRIEPILDILNGETMDQEQQMMFIMEALSDTVTPIPDVGTLCTFVYNAKTPNLSMINIL